MNAAQHRDPARIPLLPQTTAVGRALVNAYVREVLGKKTSGRVLNVGAGDNSKAYHYHERLQNTEYHTLDTSTTSSPTYISDAANMVDVPTETYDWVLAFALLEHVTDMQAVVREMTRVLKPGGSLYMLTPFHNELHFTEGYGDYWRVSPFGYQTLLAPAFGLEEIEYWGDCVVDPVSVGVVARKGGTSSPCVSRLYEVEGGIDSVHRLIRGDLPFRWAMPIWRLKLDGLEYCLQVQKFRSKFFADTGRSITIRAADRLLFNQASVAEGTIVIDNDESRLILSETKP